MKATELKKLDQLIEAEPFKDNVMTIEQMHGFLCATISNPVEVPVKSWTTAIFGNDKNLLGHESADALQEFAIQMHTELLDTFQNEAEIKPLILAKGKSIDFNEASDEQIASWCAGYMAGVSANQKAWLSSGHNDIYNLLTPISAFAQFFDGNQPKDNANTAIDPQTIRQQFLALLPATITNIFHFWCQHQHCNHGHTHHHHHHVETVRHQGPKVGRNDPCICGSSKKFKKCCGI